REPAHGSERHLDQRVAGAVLGARGEHLAAAEQGALAEPALDRRERRAQLRVGAGGGGQVDGGREERSREPAPDRVKRLLDALVAAWQARDTAADLPQAPPRKLPQRSRDERLPRAEVMQ